MTSAEDNVGTLVNSWAVSTQITVKDGLTKRELFSAMAMQGQVSHYGAANPEQVSKMAVKMADALIKELNNTNQESI